MSQLIQAQQHSFTDYADSNLVVGAPVNTAMLGAISGNAKFAAVRRERFYMGFYQNGNTVAIPGPSPVDGYVYSRAEVTYYFSRYSTRLGALAYQYGAQAWASQTYYSVGARVTDSNNGIELCIAPGRSGVLPPVWPTAPGATVTDGTVTWQLGGPGFVPGQLSPPGIATSNSGAGNLRQWSQDVNDATGAVSSTVVYRDSGGSDTTTSDGIIKVYAWGQRNASLSMSAVPTPATGLETSLVGGLPLKASVMLALNRAAKYGVTRFERIFMGWFGNNGTVPTPVSPVDGYHYGRAETAYQAMWADTGAPQGFTQGQHTRPSCSPSIDGRVLWVAMDVNDLTGAVSTQVNYATADPPGSGTVTYDGCLKIFAVGQRGSSSQAS